MGTGFDLDTHRVLGDVFKAVERAERKHPDQHLPHGTGRPGDVEMRNLAQHLCDEAAKKGELTWRRVLEEETREVNAETSWPEIRKELLDAAAVLVRWIKDGDQAAAAELLGDTGPINTPSLFEETH